jgi:Protein of unknown function (DUF3050)
MENHVFAVWDFMTLLKALQRSLTCVELPWTPPKDTQAARLINEIVLGEETDEIASGQYMGHFHLYLAAMNEVGASTKEIVRLIGHLREGFGVDEALLRLDIPGSTRDFVMETMRCAKLPTHQVAGAFLLGRETLLPLLFERVLSSLAPSGKSLNAFRLYLRRHAELDAEQHGPMAEKLLRGLCGADSVKWKEVGRAAQDALSARLALWDGIYRQIEAGP